MRLEVPDISAAEEVNTLNVDPGSYVSFTHWFRHIRFSASCFCCSVIPTVLSPVFRVNGSFRLNSGTLTQA